MVATISKWGNSQGLRLPKALVKELELGVGDRVKIFVQDKKLIIEPIKQSRKKYNIKELVKRIPSDYEPFEEFSDKMGIEKW